MQHDLILERIREGKNVVIGWQASFFGGRGGLDTSLEFRKSGHGLDIPDASLSYVRASSKSARKREDCTLDVSAQYSIYVVGASRPRFDDVVFASDLGNNLSDFRDEQLF